MEKKELGNDDRSTRSLPLPSTGNTSSVETSNTLSANNNNESLGTDLVAMKNETFPPVGTCTFLPTTAASMSTLQAANITAKRATKLDVNKTLTTSVHKKTALVASTMDTNQVDHHATEEEISLVSPGAIPVPGTNSSLGSPDQEPENRGSELVPPRLADHDQSLVILPA